MAGKFIFSPIKPKVNILILWLLINITNAGFGQVNDSINKNDSVTKCEQKDLRDLFQKKNKPPNPPKKTMVLILPSVTSNPSKGLMVGVSGTVGWYFGPKTSTWVSSLGFTAVVTTEQQFIGFHPRYG